MSAVAISYSSTGHTSGVPLYLTQGATSFGVQIEQPWTNIVWHAEGRIGAGSWTSSTGSTNTTTAASQLYSVAFLHPVSQCRIVVTGSAGGTTSAATATIAARI